MNRPPLPSRIGTLRQLIADGTLTAAEAIGEQRALAVAADTRYRAVVAWHPQGEVPATGPLAGVALAHKDIFEIAGHAATRGRPHGIAARAGQTAPVVARLEAAGAVNLAALGMAELACGATGSNPWRARPVNPIDAAAVVGGSSSGSAVAVAGGICYASLGTDTAGSVRIPAATCGLVGLKPTYDVLSRIGVYPLAPSLDTVGIVARCAADVAQVFAAAAAQPEPQWRAALESPQGMEQWLRTPRQWRVAHHFPSSQLSGDVARVLGRFVDELQAYGPVKPIALDGMDAMTRRAHLLLHVEAADTHLALLRDPANDLAPSTKAVLVPGAAIPALWYRDAVGRRAATVAAFVKACFADADLLLVPALPHGVPDWDTVTPGAPGFSLQQLLALHSWMPFANYLGLPALVFPVGRDARGRPVCVQVIARPHAEAQLLAFADRYERDSAGVHTQASSHDTQQRPFR